MLEEKEHLLQSLKKELDGKHQSAMAAMKAQWQREKEEEIKRKNEIQLTLAKKDWIREQEQVRAPLMAFSCLKTCILVVGLEHRRHKYYTFSFVTMRGNVAV